MTPFKEAYIRDLLNQVTTEKITFSRFVEILNNTKMKSRETFITIQHIQEDISYDYPSNVPLPRMSETVIYENSKRRITGTVNEVRHVFTNGLTEIRIILT